MAYGQQQQTVEVKQNQTNRNHGEVQIVDGGVSDAGNYDNDYPHASSTRPTDAPVIDDKRPTKEQEEEPEQQQQVQPPPQVLPASTTSTPAPEAAMVEDNKSDQSTGPVKFKFVDSFWTDYTALGGVIASTSSESITAQPLAPVTRLEVEPGQGEAILAVVLRNVGFGDVTSVSGSLDLPSGFRAIITPENVDSDTSLASYNGIVNAGQTFTLYFRVLITADTQIGKEYNGDLKLRYFRIDEQEEEDTRSTSFEIPFRLTGKVIVSASAVTGSPPNSASPGVGVQPGMFNIISANPGVINPFRIGIINNGSAIATGVVVNVLPPGITSSANTQNGAVGSSNNVNNNNSAETITTVPSQPTISSSLSSATMVIVGSPTFNLGVIGAKGLREIIPSIFPADSAAGTLSTLNIEISYNDAYGNRRTLNQVLGIQILPESPQSGLNVSPTSFASWNSMLGRTLPLPTPISFLSGLNSNVSMIGQPDIVNASNNNNLSNNSGTATNLTSSQPESIQITAGSVQDLSFEIANNNNQGVTITNVVVSLSSESGALRILGDSRWNLQSLGPGSRQELSTNVYASTSLIGSPVFFTVTMQYIRNGNELRTESFHLGAIVIGNVQISANDAAISFIGDTPNLVGNLLNEGNSPAIFTKIELYKSGPQGGQSMLQPTVSSQYLGDLAVNSPLPFSIPLQVSSQNPGQAAISNDYPISLKITYSDELRNTHDVIVNETISLEPIEARMGQQQPGGSSQQDAVLTNGFVDAYWVDNGASTSSGPGNLSSVAGTTSSTLPSEREVGPGEGPTFLAVVLSNTAFSDINGIIGYLTLPIGFAATTTANPAYSSSLNATNGTSSEVPSNQIAISSLSNVVRAGQTYTLYFPVNVLGTAQRGLHEALLRINYFKVPEPQPGTYRVQTVTVPFEVTGRVILDASSDKDDLVPGEGNNVTLTIRNTGSADANGVVVNINTIGGSIITNNAEEVAEDTTNSNTSSNSNVGTDVGRSNQEQTSDSAAIASVGARTFNIGSIPANSSTRITTTVYPSSSAGGTLQNLEMEITYNNANGDRRSMPISVGFRILPNPPEGGLSVAPSSIETLATPTFILASATTGAPNATVNNNTAQNNNNDASEVTIIAGQDHEMNFNITNNNRNPITDVVVTLTSRSESLEITGDSRWTLQELSPQDKARLSTHVFASDTLIGSPVSFEVTIQYISGDQMKTDSFSLGGKVIGEIKINVNELTIRNIGDVPNLTGNLLNQGNTNALFTTIELLRNPSAGNQTQLVPLTNAPQYLGDLEDNSPLPFSIPLAGGSSSSGSSNNGLSSGVYPVSLRITYSDELRDTHELNLNNTVIYNAPPQQQGNSPNQGFLGFGSSTSNESTSGNSIPLLPIILAAIGGSVLILFIVRRRRSRSKKISRPMSSEDDNDIFDETLEKNFGSSENNESLNKK